METFNQERFHEWSDLPVNNKEFPGRKPKDDLIDSLFHRVISENDYHAFELLFTRMYSPLCQFCLKFVLVKEVAEELVSDVFFSIWKNRHVLLVTTPRPYLFTSVRNRSFDYLRKTKRSVMCDLENASDVPTTLADSQDRLVEMELSRHIDHSISDLPKQCKLIFELSRDQGMRYKEIAAALNISVKTVETQMGRALKHLRKTLPAVS